MPNYINLNQREIEVLQLIAVEDISMATVRVCNLWFEITRLSACGFIDARDEDDESDLKATEAGIQFLNDRAMVKPEPEDKHWLVEYIHWDEKHRSWDDKSHLVIAPDELTAAILFFNEHEAEFKKKNIEVEKVNGDYPAHPLWIKE